MAFYNCSESLCNRKYKTEKNLIDHLKSIHKITDDNVITAYIEKEKERLAIVQNDQPINIRPLREPRAPRESNQNIETNRQRKERLQREQQERDHQIQLNRIKAIEEANEKIHKAKLEAFEKERQEKERINALMEKVDQTIKERIDNKKEGHSVTDIQLDIDTCNICMDSKIDSVIVDCGHEVACMECMDALYAHGLQGKFNCPGCRKPVTKYIKKYRL